MAFSWFRIGGRTSNVTPNESDASKVSTEFTAVMEGLQSTVGVIADPSLYQDTAMENHDQEVEKRDEEIKVRDHIIRERDQAVKEQNRIIETQNYLMGEYKAAINKHAEIADCNNATILSQLEEIEQLKALLESQKASNVKEINRLRYKRREEKKRFLPCYQVGRLVREYRMNLKSWVPTTNGNNESWSAVRVCNCASHQGRPLADASLLLYDEKLRPVEYSEDLHQDYMCNYSVLPQTAFDNYGFKKFQALLRMYMDVEQFAIEDVIGIEDAGVLLYTIVVFVSRIHTQGIYKNDMDILMDPEANAAFNILEREYELGVKKHQAFHTELCRRAMGDDLPSNLLDI